jgi:hypothetical protein
MGALMAYLFQGRQSENFLLLAPRAAILRKLEDESAPGSRKYIFVDSSSMPEPRIWHRGNIETFDPRNSKDDLFSKGPNLFVFSPQSLTGDDKKASRTSEFSGTSLIDHLKSLDDLVVIMDEAHHLGKVAERETKAWTQAIRELRPRIQIGMTATPRYEEGVNILHSYDLRTCLREKLYTKDVRIIVRQRTDADRVTEEEWDRHTLDFALDRLSRKELALKDYHGSTPFPPIQPVLLVCAEDTNHAESVASWLKANRGLADSEILVTHSERTKTEEDIERLVGIEGSQSKIKVVVNVFELTEGWDVTNVYVIAPLRRMGTFQGAIQTMGRGLRLPAGKRVDDPELDTLDVLCFGKESLQEVLKSALKDYGDDEDKDSFVQVRDARDEELARQQAMKTIRVDAQRSVRVILPHATRRPLEPDLDFDPSTIRQLASRTAVEFDLAKGAVSGTAEGLKYEFDAFVRISAGRVIEGLRYLSDPIHRPMIERMVGAFLEGLGQKKDAPVALDWVQVAEVIKEQIDRPYRKKESIFEITDRENIVEFSAFDFKVPESFESPPPVRAITKWDSTLTRIPISGWKRCTHKAAAFDVEPEFLLAIILDSAAEVEWWARNDPPQLKIATPIGNYEPDFVASCRLGKNDVHLIIEAKRGDFWQPADSDPRVKAQSADAWCDAVNRASGKTKWAHWVVLDIDIPDAHSLKDLERIRVNLPIDKR